MMQAGHDQADSLHRLVMDLHKQLNAMQAALAEETIDGAAVYGLADADRPLVAAFMAGLNRTARLKFDHPGLATTATRCRRPAGDPERHRHHRRACHRDPCRGPDRQRHLHRRASGTPALLPGHAEAARRDLGDRSARPARRRRAVLSGDRPHRRRPTRPRCRSLSRLSRLPPGVPDRLEPRPQAAARSSCAGPDRLALLLWAAEHEIGHRGFLELGGARLVNQAIEATAGSAMHFGDRLCDVLGDAET